MTIMSVYWYEQLHTADGEFCGMSLPTPFLSMDSAEFPQERTD